MLRPQQRAQPRAQILAQTQAQIQAQILALTLAQILAQTLIPAPTRSRTHHALGQDLLPPQALTRVQLPISPLFQQMMLLKNRYLRLRLSDAVC